MWGIWRFWRWWLIVVNPKLLYLFVLFSLSVNDNSQSVLFALSLPLRKRRRGGWGARGTNWQPPSAAIADESSPRCSKGLVRQLHNTLSYVYTHAHTYAPVSLNSRDSLFVNLVATILHMLCTCSTNEAPKGGKTYSLVQNSFMFSSVH